MELMICVFLLVATTGVTCLELTATKYVQADLKSNVTLKCSTKQSSVTLPIASCQFRIWYNGKKEAGDLIDITESKYPALIKNLPMPNTTFTAVSSGTSFKARDCGVTLTGVLGTQLLVGCKLTTDTQDSALKVIPLFFTAKDKLELIGNSGAKNVTLGENVSFGLKTKDGNKLLSKCYITKLNGVPVTVYNTSLRNKPATLGKGRYEAWLEKGECGVTIMNLTESDDRTIYLVAEADGGTTTGAKVVTLIIKQDLEMELDKRAEDANVGDLLKATCTARVVPDQDLVWSWRLGTQGYGIDKTVLASNATWRWPWETAVISGSREFNLTEQDRNKDVTCTLGKLNEETNKKKEDRSTSLRLNFKMPTTFSTASTTINQSLPSPPSSPPLLTTTTATKTTTATTTTTTTTIAPTAAGQKSAETNNAATSATKENSVKESRALPMPSRGVPVTEKGASAAGESQGWKLVISPAADFTIAGLETKTVMCKSDPGTRLADCGFSMDTADQPVYFNASLGSMRGDPIRFGGFTVKYHGLGLHRGECGIKLTAPVGYKQDTFLLGCRARTENSGWKYNYTYVVDTSWLPDRIRLRTELSWPFLLPGSSLTMQCDHFLGTKVEKCSFTLPGQEQFDIAKNHVPKAPHFYQYVGEGLDKGQCGIFIPDVSTLDSSKGNKLTCEIMIDRRTFSTREARIFVAAPPAGDPKLITTPPDYSNGPLVTFKCTAPASRPPASLSWYLGVDPVSTSKVTEVPVDKWRWWRDLEGTTHTLTFNLTEADEGKEVSCVMSHLALKETRRSSLTIEFPKYPPVGDPTLTITPEKYTYNSTVTLECVAPTSQPPASITIFKHSKGDEPGTPVRISQDPVAKSKWWGKAESTTRYATIVLTEADEGSNITCVMTYVTKNENYTKTAALVITIKDTTKPPPPPPTPPQPLQPRKPQQSPANAGPVSDVGEGRNVGEDRATDNHDSDFNTGTVIGVLAAVLVVIAILTGIAFTFIKKVACFQEHGSEEAALNPSRIPDGHSAPQQARRPHSGRARAVPTQQVQPLRERRPTPPDEQELQPMRSVEEPDEKVEYAEIVRAPDAPAVVAPAPTPTPQMEEVEYTVLSWDHRK